MRPLCNQLGLDIDNCYFRDMNNQYIRKNGVSEVPFMKKIRFCFILILDH